MRSEQPLHTDLLDWVTGLRKLIANSPNYVLSDANYVGDCSMNDVCGNCAAQITQGSAFKMPNPREIPENIAWINFITKSEYSELCAKCSGPLANKAYAIIDRDLHTTNQFIHDNITHFPMFTVSWLPHTANVVLKNMVTANITVGTGLFSEFSQGFSDMFGVTNVNSGMSLKVNRGRRPLA